MARQRVKPSCNASCEILPLQRFESHNGECRRFGVTNPPSDGTPTPVCVLLVQQQAYSFVDHLCLILKGEKKGTTSVQKASTLKETRIRIARMNRGEKAVAPETYLDKCQPRSLSSPIAAF